MTQQTITLGIACDVGVTLAMSKSNNWARRSTVWFASSYMDFFIGFRTPEIFLSYNLLRKTVLLGFQHLRDSMKPSRPAISLKIVGDFHMSIGTDETAIIHVDIV